MDDFNNGNNGGVNLTKEPEPQDTDSQGERVAQQGMNVSQIQKSSNQGESNVQQGMDFRGQQNFGGISEQNQPFQNTGSMGGFNTQQGGGQQDFGEAPGLAIASLVCGIVSIIGFCCCIPVGIICGIAAIVCGVISRVKNMNGAGMAIAGIVTGAVGFVGTVIWAIIGGAMRDNFADMLEEAMESVCLFMFM